jgi:alkylated DNA repair protein alkB family protein 6
LAKQEQARRRAAATAAAAAPAAPGSASFEDPPALPAPAPAPAAEAAAAAAAPPASFLHRPTLLLPLSSLPSYRVSPPALEGCAYVPCAVSAGDGAALLSAIDGAPAARWVELRGRRLQQWGGAPLPGGVIEGAEPLPPFLAALADALVACGVFPPQLPPNHALVNDYAAGEGIAPHTDGPRYHPCVATLSLGDAAPMRFSALHGREAAAALGFAGGQPAGELLLEDRSLVVTWGALYSDFAHAIPQGCGHALGGLLWNGAAAAAAAGDAVPREGRRVSITLRHAFASA